MDFDEMRNAYKRATEQDITDRLKSLIGANYATWDVDVDNAMQESIDEIERLRELCDELHKRGMLQAKATDKAWEAYKEVTGCDE